jgi:GntR family negative regulator for fad regulon and positive regulator of fabA
VPNLLEVRISLAPTYTRAAIEREPRHIAELLTDYAKLEDTPQVFAASDWDLHRHLTIDSGNPVFTLILNGFNDLYQSMALIYFSLSQARVRSRVFYRDLGNAAMTKDPKLAESITRQTMIESLDLWRVAIKDYGGGMS